MGRLLLSIVLGLFAPVVAFMGAEVVEVPGQNPIRERVVGGLAVALYLAICQFLVTPRGSRKLGANWPTMVALGAPLLALFVVAQANDRGAHGIDRARRDVGLDWIGPRVKKLRRTSDGGHNC